MNQPKWCCDWAAAYMCGIETEYCILGSDEQAWHLKFCPMCGHDFAKPVVRSVAELIDFLLKEANPLRICFDVDGVLCDDKDPSIPYAERPPYNWVAHALAALRQAGHTIVVQTARYMARHRGNQWRAAEAGYGELYLWLRRHGIHFDEVYFGKASADVYADDRGCRIESARGIIDWPRLLPLIQRPH